MTLPINTTICRIGIRYYAANPNAIAKTKQNPHSPKQRETRRRRNFACLFTFTSCPCKGVVDTCVGAVCRAARLYLPRKPYALSPRARRARSPPPASRLEARALHRVPCLRPSAARVRLQPAPVLLGHLQRHENELDVRSARLPSRRAPRYMQSCPLPCARCVHHNRVRPVYIRGRRLARRPSYPVHPPCDSAGRTLPVRRKQAAHPLRVGGQLGLSLLLWPRRFSAMALGSLPLKPSPRCACGRGRVYLSRPCRHHSPQHIKDSPRAKGVG